MAPLSSEVRQILSSKCFHFCIKYRTNTTPGQAMHLISAVLKSVQKDGESLDLNEETISESSIRRGREKAREEISKQQYQDFQDNMPWRSWLQRGEAVR